VVWAWLAIAAGLGKACGGLVGDHLGWARTSALALILSVPLLSGVGSTTGAAVVSGMFLFQMTTPITLKAIHHILPSRPGLAFGLPCLTLLLGALPVLLGVRLLDGRFLPAAGIVVAAVWIVTGLRLLARAGGARGPAEAREVAEAESVT